MSSRQQEKERRRQERIEREQAAARAAAGRKRLQLVGGVLLGVAAVAAIVIAVVIGTGGGNDEESATAGSEAVGDVKLPEQQTSDFEEAAKAAGCTLTHAKFEGAGHEEKDFTAADYKTNPPTSGTHFPTWYEDGTYEPGTVPKLGMLVHTLEHGRINVQYKPGTSAEVVAQLEALVAEQNEGYHMLLYENTTGMDAAVAATAWTQLLSCPSMNDKVFDALRTFRARYIDKGPESVP